MEKAPYFLLPDQNGINHSLAEYEGKWILIYFYPKDDTPGCTKEACQFRDTTAEYREKNITVIGISKDSVISHKKFAEKYHLSFTLLSDETKEVIKAYGAWGEKKFMGKVFEGTIRMSFLIDPHQFIRKTYTDVNPITHAISVIRDYMTL